MTFVNSFDYYQNFETPKPNEIDKKNLLLYTIIGDNLWIKNN